MHKANGPTTFTVVITKSSKKGVVECRGDQSFFLCGSRKASLHTISHQESDNEKNENTDVTLF